MDEGIGPAIASSALHRLLDHGDAWLNHNLRNLLGDVPAAAVLLQHGRITSRGMFLAAALLLMIWLIPPCTEWLLRRFGCMASNYRGERIPQSYGLAVLISAGVVILLDAWIVPSAAAERLLWLECIAYFGLLGFLDDILGDRNVKGLRGHVGALMRDRRLTTGMIKAVGGALVAIWAGYRLHGSQPQLVLLSASVIALSANAMNLLDLRPGRACGSFCVAAILLLAAIWRREGAISAPGLLYITVPTLAVWPHDADGQVMLGDTGSNLLGASLGLGFCMYFGTSAQVVALLCLAALHILAERVSISQVIEGNALLRAIDRFTGSRSDDGNRGTA